MTAALLRRLGLVAAVLGVAATTAVVVIVGAGPVLAAVVKVGWRGLGAFTLWSALPYLLLGTAWFSLERPWTAQRWRAYLWARMVRDASGELLPFSPIGGLAIGVRAAVLEGVGATWAAATTTVDVTAEMAAQVVFTLFGLAVLGLRLGHDSIVAKQALAGVAMTAAAIVAFAVLQRRGVSNMGALIERFAPGVGSHFADTSALIGAIHARPGRLALAVLLHLLAWIASALGAWLALAVGGVAVGAADIIGLEALIMAVRSAAFLAPMGIGVQEASYALLGPLFGLGPELAVALSFIKRARELIVGGPVLALWQVREGRRLLAAGR